MKFLTLEQGQIGALFGDLVVDLVAAGESLGTHLQAATMLELIELGDAGAEAAWVLATTAAAKGLASRKFSAVKPRAPIPQPRRNIFCIGKNYRGHVEELAGKIGNGEQSSVSPVFFSKATTSVVGPGDFIPYHGDVTAQLDYEAEVAIVLGKQGKDIPRSQAMDYVFGYTALNDISARDLQVDAGQWFRGKSLDGFAPMGPVLVHRSIMPPAQSIGIECRVNGELRQQATLDQLIYDIPSIISILSQGMTLLAGDIISTGSPAGVGMGFDPPRFLKSGDEIAIDITGVGRLVNRID